MYLPPVQNAEQITKDPTLLAVRPWWVVLLGSVILYLVPAGAALELPVLGATVEWLASLVPSIGRWTELSPFSASTKLFAVFIWVMIPVQVYWLTSSAAAKAYFRTRRKDKDHSDSIWTRLRAIALMLILLCVFVLIPFNFAIIDSPPCKVCVNTVRWAQLFIGCAYSLTISGLIAMFALVVPMLFKPFNSQGNSNV